MGGQTARIHGVKAAIQDIRSGSPKMSKAALVRRASEVRRSLGTGLGAKEFADNFVYAYNHVWNHQGLYVELRQNPSPRTLPRNKWVKGQIRVTSAGKIQFRKV